MESPKITRQMLCELKRKFEDEQERKRLEEEKLAEEKRIQRLREERIAEEKKREEMIDKANKMVKQILDRMVGAASSGEDTIVVQMGNMWEYSYLIIQCIRREIPDICINVHEYDKNDGVGGIFSSKLKSISISWKPGSGRGYLG